MYPIETDARYWKNSITVEWRVCLVFRNLQNVTIRIQFAKILGGDLGTDLLHRVGQERDRGGAHQTQAGSGLYRGGLTLSSREFLEMVLFFFRFTLIGFTWYFFIWLPSLFWQFSTYESTGRNDNNLQNNILFNSNCSGKWEKQHLFAQIFQGELFFIRKLNILIRFVSNTFHMRNERK